MNDYILLFFAGFAGSLHCVGMCGGFACALGRRGAANIPRQLLYNLGRITTYAFIGALVGHLGLLLLGHQGEGSWASHAQRLLAVLSGLLMVVVGLQFFGVRLNPLRQPTVVAITFAGRIRQLVAAPGLRAPLAFGVFNGLLPCPLVYAFAAQAAGSGGALPGLLVMLAFGLGTLPAMLAMGALGVQWRRGGFVAGRLSVLQLGGAFLVLLGLITSARGVLPIGAHLHIT